MSQFKEVSANDFLTFSREQPSYVLIEQSLIELGGGGNTGVEFKKSVMQAAGWKHGKLVSYGAHADKAADVFNRIRDALDGASNSDELMNNLSQ